MAIKLVLVISLIVFLCCVVVAPAGELPRPGDPQLTTASTTFSSWLAGGTLEELCGCTVDPKGMMACSVRDLLRAAGNATVVLRHSGRTVPEVMFNANADALRDASATFRSH